MPTQKTLKHGRPDPKQRDLEMVGNKFRCSAEMGLHDTAQRLVSRPRSSELQEIEARTRNWRLVWPAAKSRRYGSLYERERQSSDVSKTTTLS